MLEFEVAVSVLLLIANTIIVVIARDKRDKYVAAVFATAWLFTAVIQAANLWFT